MHISSGLKDDIIRVGIVLPEDKLQTIALAWASDLEISGTLPGLTGRHQLVLSIEDGKIIVSDLHPNHRLNHITLNCPDDPIHLSAHYGIHLEPVIAGRGFHWEKQIAVDLPGRLEITIQDGFFKVINFVNIEAYVACVATSEMGAEAPAALLAAQTIVARCWSMALAEAKHVTEGFDVCNDDCCQRYQGTSHLTNYSLKAAIDTRGEVLVFDNKIIDARYSKNCGGMVEAYETVWAGGPVPYLIPLWDAPVQRPGQALDNLDEYWNYDEAYCSSHRFKAVNLASMLGKVDVSGSYYRWEQVMSKSDLLKNLKKYTGLTWIRLSGIRIMERGPSGRIKYLFLDGINDQGNEASQMVKSEYGIRQMFSESFLYSSAFVIKNALTLAEDDHIVLKGAGWGHGVGLCQMGALGMALDNVNYSDILLHYYPGTHLTTL